MDPDTAEREITSSFFTQRPLATNMGSLFLGIWRPRYIPTSVERKKKGPPQWDTVEISSVSRGIGKGATDDAHTCNADAGLLGSSKMSFSDCVGILSLV